ncbi:fimbrial protein [Burkholderia pseudomultivorans]|uniref:Fimbrial protein n=1 Tax=Burkholderia pseudomultivorans TaxID=1207504 RepID=A0A6P2MU80_9BURK|nr:fimbrial protein [Burkholderia pseudomultivorans]
MRAGRVGAAGYGLGGFNLLPYRERLAQALRRRRAAQCGAAILLGVLGVGLWTAGAAWRRTGLDAERARVEARLRRVQPQVDAATRAASAAAGVAQRDAQAAVLAAPYRRIAALLAMLARARDGAVRLDALHVTFSGATLDLHATNYRAAAQWLAGVARERQDWRIDVGSLKPAPAAQADAAAAPFRFSVQLRWRDEAPPQPGAAGGGA